MQQVNILIVQDLPQEGEVVKMLRENNHEVIGISTSLPDALNMFSGKQEDLEYLFIKKNKSLKKVFIADILYVEVESRYCNIVTAHEKFLVLISLSRISELFQHNKFVRTHRNYLVNTEKITEIISEDNLLILQGNHKVMLSDKYKGFTNSFYVLR